MEAGVGVPMTLKTHQKREAQATEVLEMSVRRLMKERKTTASVLSTSFATLHRERLVSSFTALMAVVHRTVNGFYITDEQRTTLKNIHVKLL
jgi:hypothetical protein